MVLLAVRPYVGGHYNLGRETFMVPFVWAEDGCELLTMKPEWFRPKNVFPIFQEPLFR